MADFVMIMKAQASEGDSASDSASDWSNDWSRYIEKLVASGMFRGGSAFGNGRCLSVSGYSAKCVTTGYMRFEANTIEEIEALVVGNPVYQANGEVELHELVVS